MARVEKEATGNEGSHSTTGSGGDAVDEDVAEDEQAADDEEEPFGAAAPTEMPCRPGLGADNTTTCGALSAT